ncbi:VCBS repeat-containing protein [Streptomyces sp. NBC_00250]|uniref:FG-GAP repeat domain-containing protein n=1 Tax=Streptomyces sp. NBC_00250 TaxID=2903641 RepID=UPI002E2814C7|nr:VCBS repeat-containing protein [Streptomyces sp. NBC_00250]
MLHTHHRRRTRRLAACTALALGVGLLSVVPTPATAEAATTARAKPRFDRDGDGRSDRVYRSATTGKLTIALSKTGTSAPFTIGADDLDGTVSQEILSADNLWGTDTPDLLTIRSDGTLRLHSAKSPTATDPGLVWQGNGWHIYNKVLAPGDLTKDGLQDLLARTPSGTLYLYSGRGTVYNGGPFKTRVKVGEGWQGYDQLVGTNDVDGDTIADIVARTTAGDLYFYKGTGSATAPFKPRVRIGGGWNAYNQIIGADDLDNDGRADLLARTPGGAFYRYLSVGGGKFGPRTYYGGGGQNLSYYLGQGGVPAYGKHGLFVVDTTGTAFTYGTLSDGTFTARKQFGAAGEYAYHWGTSSVHAMNSNDRATLLTANNAGLYGDGGSMVSSSPAFRDYQARISIGDITGDGPTDVLGLDLWGSLFLYPGVKHETPTRVGAAVKIGTGWKVDKLIGAGDVTGDGRPDLISRYDNRLYVHPGTGSPTAPFAARVLIGSGWDGYAHLVAPGDMNGDGRADLVAVTPGGDVYRYTATGLRGAATFTARVKIATGWTYEHIS